MRALGATVIEAGEDFDDARAAAAAYVADHDGAPPRRRRGPADLDRRRDAGPRGDRRGRGRAPAAARDGLVPVGNGALINGVGSWLRATAPGCRVVGVGAAGAPAMTLSWRAGRPIDTDAVGDLRGRHRVAGRDPRGGRADGRPGRRHGPRRRGRAPRGAGRAGRDELGLTVEGAAAAAWAGVLAGPRPDGAVLLIITGTNV